MTQTTTHSPSAEVKPNPGSAEAIAAGCTCPVIDNHHGEGVPSKGGPLFWYTEGCPVHTLALKARGETP